MKVEVFDCNPLEFKGCLKFWKKSKNKKIDNGRIVIKGIHISGSFHYVFYKKKYYRSYDD